MVISNYITPVMYLDITGEYAILNYHILGEFPNYNKQMASFNHAYLSSEITNVIPGISVSYEGVYFEGGLDLFSSSNKLTFAHLNIGILSTRFITQNSFEGVNAYVDMNFAVASLEFGTKIDAKFQIIGMGLGFIVNEAFSIGATAYLGFGITFDTSTGIKVGGAFGYGVEIDIVFDWNEIFKLFN